MNNKKRKLILLFSLVLMAAVFIIPVAVNAQTFDASGWIKEKLFLGLAWMVYGIVWVIGQLFVFITSMLQSVFEYNNFINVSTVQTGWVIVRDLCNMFFVLILLVIAFATILRQESYSAKRLLGKLIIMAVMINFSKMICGLIIDFSQLIMLTFVNGLGNGSNNLVDLLGFRRLISMVEASSANPNIQIDSFSMFGALLAGLAAAIVAFVVVIVLLITLIFRIVMLWIYVILSPIAYLCSAFPGGQQYAGQWWKQFTEQIVSGPVLAFFYWLALSTARDSMTTLAVNANAFRSNIPSDFWSVASFQTYAVTLALLVGGLIVTKQAGGFAGQMAGKGIGWAQKYTGARRLRERYDAFSSRRESERKAKVSESGDKWFSRYKMATTAPGALVKSQVSRLSDKVVPQRYQNWKAERARDKEQRAAHRQHLYDISEKTVGESFEKGNKIYERTSDGVRVTDRASGKVKDISDASMRARARYDREMSPARQIQDSIAKSRVDKIKGNLSGLSVSELRKALSDVSASRDDKAAAAMMLATKEGFGGKDKTMVDSAKTNLSGLPSLMKEFNETMDRRFGLLNNDEESFKAKVSDGTIDITRLDTSQLDQKSVDLVAKISGIEFNKKLETMGRTDQDRDNIKAALSQNIENRSFTGDDLNIRKAYAGFSGKLMHAFTDNAGVVRQPEMEEVLSSAKSKHLAAIDKGDIADMRFQQSFIKAVDFAQLKNLQRSNESPERMKAYLKAIKSGPFGTTTAGMKLRADIASDKELAAIYDKA